MNLYEKLMDIQTNIKIPKSQFNKFGNYHYRNTEDVVEGLKPFLEKHKLIIHISDELVQIGERYYVKATVTLIDLESESKITTTGYAREAENQKGMDASQLTGSTSSYARKYALNGLFAVDDTKDSDTTNKHSKEPTKAPNKPNATKANSSTDEELKCSDCSTDIKQAVSAFSNNKFGKSLCINCQKKQK